MFVLPFIIFGIFFVTFLMIAISAFKTHKRTSDTIQDMINTASIHLENETQNLFEQPKEEFKVCEYCGSRVSATSLECSSCGAKIKK